MITKPVLKYRRAQPYVAIRTQVPIPFGEYLPPLWEEVQAWLKSEAIAPCGPPFLRYLTTDMSKNLDIEVGFPVAAAVKPSGRLSAGAFPAGNYAVLMYTGSFKGTGLYQATVTLLDWAKANQIKWDTSLVDQTEWWGGRIEWYLTDPQDEPDPEKWQTELAFRVADP